jgi:hypothetical protein
MPASRLPSRTIKSTPAPKRWPLILIGAVLLLAVTVFLLPASMITRFLPPEVHAEDFSGSFIHGAAGKISINAHDTGAIEWQLRLLPLFGLTIVADIHWVKVSFVTDGTVLLDRHGLSARDISGGGPIENLRDLGLAAGWRGIAKLQFNEIKSDFRKLLSADGKIDVTDLSSTQIAAGSALGGYELLLGAQGFAADGNINASLKDTGGPIEVDAKISYSPSTRTAILSGTLKERADADTALRHQLDQLSQLRPKDAQGRFPVELEFRL